MSDVKPDDQWRHRIFRFQKNTDWLGEYVKAFTKWFFDLIKNVMLVAAVKFFGEKSGSLSLVLLGKFMAFMLIISLLWDLPRYTPEILDNENGIRNIIIRIMVLLLFWFLLGSALNHGYVVIDDLIKELVNAQLHSK